MSCTQSRPVFCSDHSLLSESERARERESERARERTRARERDGAWVLSGKKKRRMGSVLDCHVHDNGETAMCNNVNKKSDV